MCSMPPRNVRGTIAAAKASGLHWTLLLLLLKSAEWRIFPVGTTREARSKYALYAVVVSTRAYYALFKHTLPWHSRRKRARTTDRRNSGARAHHGKDMFHVYVSRLSRFRRRICVGWFIEPSVECAITASR